MAHLVLVADPTDEPQKAPGRVELFPDVKDVNSVPEVAQAFGVCPQTIRRLIASGELECIRIGRAVRVTKKAMVEFIESQEVK